MLNNKGAMFGLDARIALAIFGALSVISGAALYSAIQDAKVTATITEMKEFGKAWEQYYLDTGSTLKQENTADNTTDAFYILKAGELVENTLNLKNWQGPYLSLAKENNFRLYNKGTKVYIHILNDKITWGDGVTSSWSPAGRCANGDTCFVWIVLSNIEHKALASGVDLKIDGIDNGSEGSFRYYKDGSGKYVMLLKISPIENPNG